jgi:hypothetical protein
LISLTDREAAIAELRNMPNGHIKSSNGFMGFDTTIYREGGRDRWICSLSLEDILQIRFGIEVQGDYLIISNLPISQRPKLAGTAVARHNAVNLQLSPPACDKQLPSLFASAMEKQRAAAMYSLTSLIPLLQNNNAKTIANAQQWYHQSFGFTPLPPQGDSIQTGNGILQSRNFGTPYREKQPPYIPGKRNFGLMQQVRQLNLSSQFEGDGLRATITWQTK